jgi:hypothetical protein
MSGFAQVPDRVARRLVRDAFWSGDRCNWLGWAYVQRGQDWLPAYRSQGPALHDGLAGIALFLGEWCSRASEPLAMETLEAGMRQLDASAGAFGPHHGFHAGSPGIAYTLMRLGRLFGRDGWVRHGLAILEAVAGLEPTPGEHGIYNGIAGSAVMLAQAGRAFGRTDLIEAAERQAGYLEQAAVRTERGGCHWPAGPGRAGSLGYAHGAAGVAVAFMEVAAALRARTRRRSLIARAEEALQYEREHFDTGARTWPWIDAPEGMPRFLSGWRNGAAGAISARSRMLDLLSDELSGEGADALESALREECDAAFDTVVAGSASDAIDFSLESGLAGNGEVLMATGKSNGRDVARRFASIGTRLYHENDMPWPCGAPRSGDSPTLLRGAAGVGLFYLRLDSTELVAPGLAPDPRAFLPPPGTRSAEKREEPAVRKAARKVKATAEVGPKTRASRTAPAKRVKKPAAKKKAAKKKASKKKAPKRKGTRTR